MKLTPTLNYYNENAEEFTASTINVDFTSVQDKFLNKLSSSSSILDFGCGAGRDTKYFLEKGYMVEAIDGSEELCKLASEYTGIEVKRMLFQELHDVEKYDGIWACSSILHLPYEELVEVMKKMKVALKDTGIIYTSFKYGSFEGVRNGRYFIDMTEKSLEKLLQDVGGLAVEEMWVTSDVRPGRGEEKWLNLFLRKK
ncbi:MAG: methyltransferase domain-containing protein [Lachnospiraceae bacterium]|nr:methyltransferase domain-containing protein [Lachnospiraceae bacterium]